MNERGFSPEQREQEAKVITGEKIRSFMIDKIQSGDSIMVGRSDGSKNEGTIYHCSDDLTEVIVRFQDGERIFHKTVDLKTFFEWQGLTAETPTEEQKDESRGSIETKDVILSAGGLLALGALGTYAVAKLESFKYPHLLESYDTNTFFENWRVFVAHHYAENPSTTMLIGSCIGAFLIFMKSAANRRN